MSNSIDIELIKNIVAILAPIIGLFIAKKGLSTWQRQLKGTRDLELSRKILMALYEIELKINDIRTLPRLNFQFDALVRQKNEDKDALRKHMAELKVGGLEAKAIWDKDFPDLLEDLTSCINALNVCLDNEVNSIIRPNDITPELLAIVNKTIYKDLDNNKDEFGKKLKEAINAL
jgi:hypothetical protein